jgi:hypothetical protein
MAYRMELKGPNGQDKRDEKEQDTYDAEHEIPDPEQVDEDIEEDEEEYGGNEDENAA